MNAEVAGGEGLHEGYAEAVDVTGAGEGEEEEGRRGGGEREGEGGRKRENGVHCQRNKRGEGGGVKNSYRAESARATEEGTGE